MRSGADRGLSYGPNRTALRAPRESNELRPLRYSINVTLDGCCHHEAGLPPDEESMRYWTAEMERADALLFGRVTYEMMESAWRQPATGTWPDWMDEWEIPFAETIDRTKKYVVSSTLSGVDWNAELVRGDLGQAVQRLKQEPGEGLFVGGVTLPLALADLGLIDEYEFLVQPVLADAARRCSPVCTSASISSSWIARAPVGGRCPALPAHGSSGLT
jgi:dihydrofolate reductase